MRLVAWCMCNQRVLATLALWGDQNPLVCGGSPGAVSGLGGGDLRRLRFAWVVLARGLRRVRFMLV